MKINMENKDEKNVEITTPESSPEIKPVEIELNPEEVKEEIVKVDADKNQEADDDKKVPYSRFKDVVDEKNKYKELIEAQNSSLGTEESTEGAPVVKEESIKEDVRKEILEAAKKVAEDTSSTKLGQMSRQMDLDRTINTYPDFYEFTEAIKDKIKDSPTLSWSDAYKIAKFETSQRESFAKGQKEAYDKIEEKKIGNVEGANKVKAGASAIGSDEIDPMAKSADGKFLYTLEELEEALPKR